MFIIKLFRFIFVYGSNDIYSLSLIQKPNFPVNLIGFSNGLKSRFLVFIGFAVFDSEVVICGFFKIVWSSSL